jgi:hypothetical protein
MNYVKTMSTEVMRRLLAEVLEKDAEWRLPSHLAGPDLPPLGAAAHQCLVTAQHLAQFLAVIHFIHVAEDSHSDGGDSTTVANGCLQLRRLLFLVVVTLILPDWPEELYESTHHQLHHLRFQPPFDTEGAVLAALTEVINATVAWALNTPIPSAQVFLRACTIPLTSDAVWPSLQTTLAQWSTHEASSAINIVKD